MSMFDLEMDYEDILEIPDGYLQVKLSDMENGEIFTGKPQISGLQTATYDDGFDEHGNAQTKDVHKVRMIITNEENEEYLDININLKKASYDIPLVRKGSVLFDFIQSILELEEEGQTNKKNVFRNVNLKQFTDFINNLEVISVKNVERHGTYHFNSFYVVKVNNKS